MQFACLVLISLFLTFTMFHSKQMMLGFPCAIFWAILGGYCYQQSTVTWDIYYFIFFASMGMTIFSLLAMFALRTRKQEIEEGEANIDEGPDQDKFIDEEGPTETEMIEGVAAPSSRSSSVRSRAAQRHARKIRWGEFR